MTAIDRLDQIEARANAATEGATLDRYRHGGGRLAVFSDRQADGSSDRKLVADFYHEEDREFYAAARTDVRALVAALRAVLEEIGSIQQASDMIAINPRPGGKVLAGERWRIAEQIRIVIEEALS